jgi:hypothetical protein
MTEKMRRALYYFLALAPFMPLVMFLVPEVSPFGFDFESPNPDPWYTKFIAIPFVISILYLYPATAASSIFGAEPSSVGWWLCALFYASAISYGLNRWARS